VDGIFVMLGKIPENQFLKHELALVFTCSIFLKDTSHLFYSLFAHLEIQMVPVWFTVGLIFLCLCGVIFCYCVLPEQMY
jgi:hypothetical protein